MTAPRHLLNDCVHCGFCLPACPTYQSWGNEMDSPRGRIHLMIAVADRAPLTPTTVAHFDKCLGCMACVPACPSGVKYDVLIEATRATIEAEVRRPAMDRWFRALLFALLPYPRRLRVLLWAQLIYQASGLRWLARRLGLVRLLPRRLRNLEALMPPVTWRQLRTRTPARLPASGARRGKVALLPGCVQKIYFDDVNAATTRVLAAEGYEVVVPPSSGCCGALSLHAGRGEQARTLARAAIAALERAEAEFVVVNAAGCGSSMKAWAHLFAEEPTWAARAAALAAKVRDVHELLAAHPAVATRHPLPLRVVYQDACHLAHAQGIRAQPRALLASIPGLTLLELDNDSCCGSAGVHNLLEPESAREIGLRKVEQIEHAAEAGAHVLVSANPGCTLQLQMLLRERGHRLGTAHPIELLDASLRGVALPERP
jgi:glycolate oxidase iron-sulfur subunit